MNGFNVVEKSRFLATLGEDPSPTSASLSFGALGEHLVIGFLGGIFPTKRTEWDTDLQK
jgi:hypothetical protein